MLSKKYIITGAANGIGQALTERLAGKNVEFLLIDIDETNLIKVGNACSAKGATVTLSVTDVRIASDMHEVVANWFRTSGLSYPRQTIVFAVAGIAETSEDNSFDIKDARNNLDTNYFGVLNTVYPSLSYMNEEGGGSLVLISSTSSYRSTRRSGEYSASKAALNLWAEGMRFKLHDQKITVHLIEPGFVATRMTENNTHFMPLMISKEKMASLIENAVRKKRKRVVLPRKALVYVIPSIFLPSGIYFNLFRLLDKYLGKKD
jgi:short-subunit dehydrogenase